MLILNSFLVIVSIQIAENSTVFVLKMVKFAVQNVDVQNVEINLFNKKILQQQNFKIFHVIVKKVNVLKNTVNAMQMDLNANKHVIVQVVKTAD